MSNQFEEGWYPACRKCGCGNLGDNAICVDCYNDLLKSIKEVLKQHPDFEFSNENRNKMASKILEGMKKNITEDR